MANRGCALYTLVVGLSRRYQDDGNIEQKIGLNHLVHSSIGRCTNKVQLKSMIRYVRNLVIPAEQASDMTPDLALNTPCLRGLWLPHCDVSTSFRFDVKA